MKQVEIRTGRIAQIAGALALAGAMSVPMATPAQAQMRGRRSYAMSSTRGFITRVGTLQRDANNKSFTMRDRRGRIYKVDFRHFANAGMADKLRDGDVVRVNGPWKNKVLYARNLRVIRSNAPQLANRRVMYQSRYYTMGQRNTLTGVVMKDADDDRFDMRASNGVIYKVLTRTIPDSYGANKLQKGQRVRVSGYWVQETDGGQPQLEASSFRVIY